MLVSIIIPNYNYANFLEICILSVLNQTHQNFEVIIIDDCSSDNSLQIANKFVYDSRIKIFKNTQNYGVCYCRNKGIEESQGEYICFLDPDDYWLSSKLEKQLNAINTQNSNLSFTDIDVLKNQQIVHTRKHFYKKYNFNTLLKRNFIPHSSLMIKKETIGGLRYKTVQANSQYIDWLLKVSHINRLIHEDYAFLLELYRTRSIKSSYIAESLVVYRTHEKNFSKSYRKKFLSLFFIYKNYEKYSFLFSCFFTVRIMIFAFWKNKIKSQSD